MATLGTVLAKGQEVAGAVESIRSVLPPGLVPPALSNAIDKLFGKSPSGPESQGISSVNRFRSNIYGTSVSRNNRFYIEIDRPRAFFDSMNEGIAKVPFLAESASIPGVQLMTSEIRRHGIGQVEKKPYNAVFVDTTMTFMVDGAGIIHKFFYKWMSSIVKFDQFAYEFSTSDKLDPYEINYKEDYATRVRIYTVDEFNRKIIAITLHDAYPIFMGDMNVAWNNQNDFLRLPITFTYTHWTSEEVSIAPLQNRVPQTGAIQKVLGVASAIQALASFKRPTGVGDIINIVNTSTSAVKSITNIFKSN